MTFLLLLWPSSRDRAYFVSMASRVAENIVNDYLTCSICCERYTDPRKLPCEHSFCAECLQNYITGCSNVRGQSSVPCPICRAELHLPESDAGQLVDQLPRDSLLISFLQVISVHEASDGVVQEKEREESYLERQKRVCALHKNSLLNVYCQEHRVVICSQCAMQNHKSKKCKCWSTSDAIRICQSKIGTLKSLMQQQISVADHFTKTEAVAQHILDESRRDAMGTIDDLQDKLEEHWNSMLFEVKYLKKGLEEACNTLDSELSSFVVSTENLKATQNMFLETCDNGSEILRVLPKVEERVADFQTKLDERKKKPPSLFKVQLHINEKLKRLLSMDMSFGSFTITEQVDPSHNVGADDSTSPATSVQGSNTRRSPEWVLVDKPKAREHCCFSAMLPGEKLCSLSGVVCMGDSIIVADQNNNKVKRFEMWTGVFIDELELEEPHQLSLIPGTFGVATTQWEHKITIVSTEGKLKIGETIMTEKNYVGICALNEERLAVSCYLNKSVDIIDRRGRVLKTIKYFTQANSPSLFFKKSLFLTPTVITQTSTGNLCVCDSKRQRVVCVDDEGNVVWSHKTTTRPSSVSSFKGQILVALQNTDCVIKMSESGECQGTAMGPSDGLVHPWAISMWRNYMIVTEDCPSGKVHIFAWADDN